MTNVYDPLERADSIIKAPSRQSVRPQSTNAHPKNGGKNVIFGDKCRVDVLDQSTQLFKFSGWDAKIVVKQGWIMQMSGLASPLAGDALPSPLACWQRLPQTP